MRKLFTLLCTLLLAVQFATAQHNLHVIDKNGSLTVYPASAVSFSDDIFSFTFTDLKMNDVATESVSVQFKIAFKSDKVKSFWSHTEVGVCYSEDNPVPTADDDCVSKLYKLSTADYEFTVPSLNASTTYYWRPYAKLGDYVYYGDAVKTRTLGTKPGDKYVDGHKFIDLGLPSGLLWAETNIGADIAASSGSFFAWGETDDGKSEFSKATYKYYNSTTDTYTKYNSTDKKTELDPEDDAAYVNWGPHCHIPTKAEFQELIDNCTLWEDQRVVASGDTVRGLTLTSKRYDNSIFLPCPGYWFASRLESKNRQGCYWANTRDEKREQSAETYNIMLYNGTNHLGSQYRTNGGVIRPVTEP